VDQGEHFHSTRTRQRAGVRVFHGWASVRTSSRLGRYSSAIRAACANERSCGSVRGAISDGRPYRDRQPSEIDEQRSVSLLTDGRKRLVEQVGGDVVAQLPGLV
jgi:hypothetical protein